LINLAEQINKIDKKPFYIYGIPRGGAIPALGYHIKQELIISTNNSAQISKMADLSHILIVDDICDSGKLKKIKENFPKCQSSLFIL
jgi:hypoxanthine phosphoribosyltransferase